MPNYHIRVIEKSGDELFFAYELNLSREETTKMASQFERGESFWFDGRTIIPKRVVELKIFMTEFRGPFYSQWYHQNYPKGYNYNFSGSDVTRQFVTKPPTISETSRLESPTSELSRHLPFLSLSEDWMCATIALQLQEVAVTILSKRFDIVLDKQNVEKILGKNVGNDLTFSMKYDAFSKEVERLYNVEMPRMAKDLRKMRTEVLHKGYNPKREETSAIVNFTAGFLQKLESIKPRNVRNAEKLKSNQKNLLAK